MASTRRNPALTQAKSRYGGVLKIIFPIEPKNIGYPGKIDRNTWYSMHPCLEGLTRIDEYGRPLPHLATGWTVSRDRKSITLTLREGVKFHDETDFNAEAVKFNLDMVRVYRPQNLPSLEIMTSINVIDTYTVRINLVRYSNALLADLSTFAGLMVSPLSIIKHSEEWAREHAVGTGPFVFDSLQRGDLLKFKRFDGYWQKGKPYLDGIEFRFINDANKAKETFLDGEAHLYHFFASKYAKNARAIASKGYEVVSLYCGLVGLLPDSNNLDSPFSDKRVREALEYAIDRPAIAKELGYGYWVALEQSFPQGHLAYNPNVKGRQYNPDKARKLLAEAGYSKGFTIKVPVEGKSISEDEMHSIQRYLKEVGIIAEPLFLTPDEYGKMKNEGWENGFTLTTIIPVHGNIAGHFERELRPNYSTYISMRRADEWGDTILKATATDNLEIHKKYVQKLTKIIYDDAMFVPLFVTSVVVAKRGGVHNDGNCLVSRMHWTPENAWLSE